MRIAHDSTYGGKSERNDDNTHGNINDVENHKKLNLHSLLMEIFKIVVKIVMMAVSRPFRSETEGHRETKSKLKMFTLEGIADFIKTERPCNVIVMTGAGISTSAGIPDLRSPDIGVCDNLQKYSVPHPQSIFDSDFFHKNPAPFFDLCKELFADHLKPTPCHYFIKMLHDRGILRRWFTQNIDLLEYRTGIPQNKVVTAHGSHRTSTCLKCSKKYDLEWMTERIRDKKCRVPKCEECGGVVKPDITFLGENLPTRFFQCASLDFPQCDLLLIMGTSLVVQPFASLVGEIGKEVPRLLINMEETGRAVISKEAARDQGLRYGLPCNKRDVFWRGSCDDGCRRLAELLGWGQELDQLIQEGKLKHERKSSANTSKNEEE